MKIYVCYYEYTDYSPQEVYVDVLSEPQIAFRKSIDAQNYCDSLSRQNQRWEFKEIDLKDELVIIQGV